MLISNDLHSMDEESEESEESEEEEEEFNRIQRKSKAIFRIQRCSEDEMKSKLEAYE